MKKTKIVTKTPNKTPNKTETPLHLENFETYHRFSFWFLLLLLIPITIGIYFIYANVVIDRSTIEFIIDKFAINPGYFAPEPQERYSYLFVLGFIPLAVVTFLLALKKSIFRQKFDELIQSLSNQKKVNSQNIIIVILCTLVLLGSQYFENYFYLQHTIIFSWEIIIAIVGAYFLQKDHKLVGWFTSAKIPWILVVLISLFRMSNFVFDSTDFNALYIDGHFDVPFYSIVRAFWGGSLYTDCPNQYGLYGMFLLPIFKLFGLNVFNYTMVMALLCVLSFLLVFYALTHFYTNRWVAFLIWFSYFGVGFIFILEGKNYFESNHMPYRIDPYFQFIPIRVLFPSLMLFFAALQDKIKKNWVIYLGSFVLSFSIFWNLEMGLVVVVSWLLFQMYQNFGFKGIAQAFLRVTSIYILGALVFVFWFYLQYESLFTISTLLAFQDIFYITGFFMLPMPIFGSWTLVALLYGWGLIYSGVTWFFKVNDTKRNLIFLVSIFGSGFFSYYQGRSHLWVFPAVTLPGFILAGYLLDYYLQKKVRWLPFVLHFIILMLSLSALKNVWEVRDDLLARLLDNDQPMTAEFDSLRSMVSRNEKVLFLTFSFGVLHSETFTQPVTCTSFPELLLKKDFEHYLQLLSVKQPYPIFMDATWLNVVKSKPEWTQLYNLITTNYEVESATPSKRFYKIKLKP